MAANQSSNPSLHTLGSVARTGSDLVELITYYLSTLPTPVDILEDLTSIVAVTSSLLNSLDVIVPQYPLPSGRKSPFIRPLCLDVEAAFESLKGKFEEAKRKKVFEPNEKGLVRTPRFSWFDIVGGEGKAAALRSRLCVEKYRARVLVDALRFKQLSDLKGLSALKVEEVKELAELKQMLPVIVERLLGVQEEYLPRLRKDFISENIDATIVPMKKQNAGISNRKNTSMDVKPAFDTSSLKKNYSWNSKSAASSVTIVDDSIEEAWLLRQNLPQSELKKTRYIYGMKLWSTYQHKARSFYVKPLPASKSEIVAIRRSALGSLSQSAHEAEFKKTIVRMSEKAQWEIQHLLETRDRACATDHIKRNWEVIAFQERPRRKITAPGEKKWWKKGKPNVEWVMILKGETVDHKKRLTPAKDENPWDKKDTKKPAKTATLRKPGDVLTHIEKRNFMPMDTAEKKMKELMRDLFEPLADD